MTELETLSRRLDAALGALETGAAGGERAARDMAELRAQNAKLHEDLARLNAAREQDLAQLDELISQLKPLVEEAV